MRFVVLNHSQDNASFIGDFESASWALPVFDAKVSVTNAGVTFFMLPQALGLSEKLRFAASLHEKLTLRFSYGLCAAMGAESLGVPLDSFSPFYAGIKRIDRSIRTLHCGTKLPLSRDRILADVCITDLMPKNRILGFLSPSPIDRQQPLMGWERYENDLLALSVKIEEELQCRIAEAAESTLYEQPRQPLSRSRLQGLQPFPWPLIPAN